MHDAEKAGKRAKAASVWSRG